MMLSDWRGIQIGFYKGEGIEFIPPPRRYLFTEEAGGSSAS